jgi:hypothetical protein
MLFFDKYFFVGAQIQDDQEGLFKLVILNFIFKWYNWVTSGC